MLSAEYSQKLDAYVISKTERILPRARGEVRKRVRAGILEYIKWIDTPRSQRGAPPEISRGYATRAEQIYRQFLAEMESTEMEIRSHEVHAGKSTDPQIYEDSETHRRSGGRH